MKRLIIVGAVWALAVAKPEVYKEKEDFQFSRSSSDEGTKSGFYGAQRGNMGGNYERAHNMDSLAQNQMGGLVKQVEGELGDGANTRAGSVYTAANSRGTFGSGHYDLSNLAGRNFQEGTTYGDSHTRSSLSSSSAYNAADYANSRSQISRHSGYQAAAHTGLNLQSGDLQSLDNTQGTGQYDYGRQSSQSAGYNAQSGFQQHSAFDTSNADLHSGYGSNVHTRLISATPVRIIVRPGTRVAIPIAAQSYDITHGSSLIDQNSLNSEAEVLSNDNQRTVYRPSNAKHYESSYNYRKEWEKHDTIPSTVILPTTPTENPFPKNSELFEDSRARTASDQYDASRVASQRVHSSNVYDGYNANVKSGSSQSHTNYDAQNHGAALHSNSNTYALSGYNAESNHQKASSDSSLTGYNQAQYNAGSRYHGAVADASSLTQARDNTGYNADLNSQVEDLNSKPKSYQSSYSYHKSWERQGDPYVIKPASSGYYDGQSSQRLSSGSTKNQGYAASGSHYQHSHQSGADCDENGHIRVARSYNIEQYQDTQQQSQNLEDLGQQVEDFGQQTQGQWVQQEGGQQAHSTWDNLEDLSQQSHNKWDEIHKTWDKFEDLGQNAENNWNQKDIGQKNQDTNNQFQNLDQKTQNDLGQHIQPSSEIEQEKNSQDVDQEAQDKWDFSSTGQHDQENDYKQSRDYHYEQSNQFNQQESQSELDEPDLFKHSQPSRRQNDNKNDQISLWDKFDNFASYQSAQQNKSKDDQENSSGNQPNWNSVSRNGDMDQQSDNSGGNLDITSQLESHNVDNHSNVKPFWIQLSGHTQQSDKNNAIDAQSNTGYFHSQDSNNQNHLSKNVNSFQETSKFYESNWNIDSSSQRQEQTFETIPSNAAPLSNLWKKLGIIEQQSTLSDERNDFTHTNSQNSYHVNEEDISQNKSNSTQTEKESPHDIGRGDIGSEDISDSVEDKKPNRRFKTPVSEVLSLNQQKPQNQINQNVNGVPDTKHYYLDFQNQENLHQINVPTIGQENLNDFGLNKNLQKQNSYHSYLEQQDSNKNGQENSQDFGQNDQQNLQDFGQQNVQNFEQHDYLEQQNYQNAGQHELPGQPQGQQNLQDFGKKQILRQPNVQDFGQHENLEHQNVQDFGQHKNMEQQNLQDFGQQNVQNFEQHDSLEQQNYQNAGQHELQDQPQGQQNLEDFGKKQILRQPNVQDFGQHENLEQQNVQDFGQHKNMEQQNLQDFGQQNVQNFEQHDSLEQQNYQNAGQHELQDQPQGQQNLQDFGKKQILRQPNVQDFGQHKNMEQQNLQDFSGQENLEQQNTQNLDLHENLQQTNLPVFGHENLEQKNTQDFVHPENLNQSNLQVFEHHEDQEQQNLQDFEQQDQQNLENIDYLEQQNFQNLGHRYVNLRKNANHEQSVSLHQQNMHDFEQQNENFEQLSQNSETNFEYSDKQEPAYPENKVQSQVNVPNPEEIEEPIQIPRLNNDLQSISPPSSNIVVSPIETETEKPGFWKSVGSKLSRAKNKIASWFQ